MAAKHKQQSINNGSKAYALAAKHKQWQQSISNGSKA